MTNFKTAAQCKPWEHHLSRRQWLGGAAAGARGGAGAAPRTQHLERLRLPLPWDGCCHAAQQRRNVQVVIKELAAHGRVGVLPAAAAVVREQRRV